MNQMVYVLYTGEIQLQPEHDAKLTRFSDIISHYLDRFMKHTKSNKAFLHEIAITFPVVYFSEEE